MSSNLVLIILSQFVVVLGVTSALLFLFLKRQKTRANTMSVRAIELKQHLDAAKVKIQASNKRLAELQQNGSSQMAPELAYEEFINHQIELTISQFRELGGDSADDVDISKLSIEKQVCILRHIFLTAESQQLKHLKFETFSWPELLGQYSRLTAAIHEPEDGVAASSGPDVTEVDREALDLLNEENASLKKRIETLEKFKQLFFNVEQAWQKAKQEAAQYSEQLRALVAATGGDTGDQLSNVLDSYEQAYSDVEGSLSAAREADSDNVVIVNKTEIAPTAVESGGGGLAHSGDLDRLKDIMRNQHSVIEGLKDQLRSAATAEDKEALIEQLKTEMDGQERVLKESEACIVLLEQSLNEASLELNQVKADLEAAQSNDLGMSTEELMASFTEETEGLLSSINSLEKELSELRSSGAMPESAGTVESSDESKQLQQELVTLQTKYAELEEQYVELKLASL